MAIGSIERVPNLGVIFTTTFYVSRLVPTCPGVLESIECKYPFLRLWWFFAAPETITSVTTNKGKKIKQSTDKRSLDTSEQNLLHHGIEIIVMIMSL